MLTTTTVCWLGLDHFRTATQSILAEWQGQLREAHLHQDQIQGHHHLVIPSALPAEASEPETTGSIPEKSASADSHMMSLGYLPALLARLEGPATITDTPSRKVDASGPRTQTFEDTPLAEVAIDHMSLCLKRTGSRLQDFQLRLQGVSWELMGKKLSQQRTRSSLLCPHQQRPLQWMLQTVQAHHRLKTLLPAEAMQLTLGDEALIWSSAIERPTRTKETIPRTLTIGPTSTLEE